MRESPDGRAAIDSLKRLVIDFHAGRITIEGADGTTFQFTVVRESVVSIEPSPGDDVPTAEQGKLQSPVQLVDSTTIEQPAPESSGQKTVRLVGKLKSAPRPGRPDSKGRPTAWAKLAVHEEGRDGARMFSTTFHGGTTNKALTLAADTVVCLEGYLRESPDPKRMDAFSCFTILTASE